MSVHAFFAPSAAHRWLNCPGSMAFAENQQEGDSTKYADDGSASHAWCAEIISNGNIYQPELGDTKVINGKTYTWDEERARFCNVYIDYVMTRGLGGELWNDLWVDISEYLGEDQGGTIDNGIYQAAEEHLISIDLKYGMRKVYAKYQTGVDSAGVPVYEVNPQLGLYLLGLLGNMLLMDKSVTRVTAVIVQPRLGHIDEYTFSVEELLQFGEKCKRGVSLCGDAMILNPDGNEINAHLSPGDKTCEWCRAKANCQALAKYVGDQVKCDFDTIHAEGAPLPPKDHKKLAEKFRAVPLIAQWCSAVNSEVWKLVASGEEVIGVDGKPMKFIEGKQGDRKWANVVEAEAALSGVLPAEKMYQPQTIIGVPAADKLLKKKATMETWTEIIEPLIFRAPGKPKLALGSDERPAFKSAASSDEFDNVEAPE